MNNPESILVIIEPNQDQHLALDRALITSKLRKEAPKLHLFICVDADNTDLKAATKIYIETVNGYKASLSLRMSLVWTTLMNFAGPQNGLMPF